MGKEKTRGGERGGEEREEEERRGKRAEERRRREKERRGDGERRKGRFGKGDWRTPSSDVGIPGSICFRSLGSLGYLSASTYTALGANNRRESVGIAK